MFCAFGFLTIPLADAANAPVLERLDPPRRAVVVMALLGLVLTGLVLVVCVMLGGHWVRRLARHQTSGSSPGTGSTSAAENRRLRESLRRVLPQASSGETLHINSNTRDTTAGP
jgi:hypothetical protein